MKDVSKEKMNNGQVKENIELLHVSHLSLRALRISPCRSEYQAPSLTRPFFCQPHLSQSLTDLEVSPSVLVD